MPDQPALQSDSTHNTVHTSLASCAHLSRQHAHNGQNLLTAPQVHTGNEHLGDGGLKGELSHLAAQAGEEALLIQRSQVVQLLQGTHQGGCCWRVHEVKAQQVVDAHGLQGEHRHAQIGALDLWHAARQHLIAKRSFRVQPAPHTHTRLSIWVTYHGCRGLLGAAVLYPDWHVCTGKAKPWLIAEVQCMA